MSLWDTKVRISVNELKMLDGNAVNLGYCYGVEVPFKQLLKIACTPNHFYSASTFKANQRTRENWMPGAQIVVIDFDEGLNEYTKSWLNQQFGFLCPTRHHNIAKAGKVYERYRAILLAETPMNVSAQDYVNIQRNILKDNNLPADESCTDVSRLFYSFGSPETNKDIKILNGKPLDWTKYNYKGNIQFTSLPVPKVNVDISKYENLIDTTEFSKLQRSKRYECPVCALEGLDPNKHHLGFSDEKDIVTCFYDNEHSQILRALYRKQVLGLDPEIDPESQEIVEEEVQQPDGKVKKKRVVKPKMETCPTCNGTGKVLVQDASGAMVEAVCAECQGTGKVPKKPKPKVKKPSLPDDTVPLKERNPKGSYHFNELGITTDFDAEYAKYVNSPILAYDIETFYNYEVACTEDECKAMFKDKYISIAATYKRVVKNLKEMALDEIDNTVRLMIFGTQEHQTAFDLTICTDEQKQKLFELVKTKMLVGQYLKFDMKSVASSYGIDILPKAIYDTCIGSQLLWMSQSTYEPPEIHKLKSIVKRFCGITLPKDQGSSDWGVSELSAEQLAYALNDVRYLIPVMNAQIKEFQKLMQTYKVENVDFGVVRDILQPLGAIHPVMALEMKFAISLARIELHGVKVNVSTIRDIVVEHKKEVEEATQKLGFNPASAPKCLEFVKNIIGPHMTSASKEALAEYYQIPEIMMLGEAKKAKARAGLLVKMYEHKADGRIHPDFTQILSTGRLACRNPNMQQIPRTVKAYIYDAPIGRSVFSADYPAIELRLGAVVHKEQVMIDAFKHGVDLHYKMAAIMTGKPIPHTDEEKHDDKFINKEERTAAKNANFGFIYGGSWVSYQQVQLVKNKIKISDDDAKKARASFMSLYTTINKNVELTKYEFKHGRPRNVVQIDSMGNQYTQQVPYGRTIDTLFGRKIMVEKDTTALNYPVQGSGGDACKIAVCLFDKYAKEEGIDAYIINLIHDDIVVESSIEDRDAAKKVLARAMNDAANCLMGHYFMTDVSDEVEVLAETPLQTAA